MMTQAALPALQEEEDWELKASLDNIERFHLKTKNKFNAVIDVYCHNVVA
jgi:hypothetical protein